jgi:P-type Ca2+ transporter type 2C
VDVSQSQSVLGTSQPWSVDVATLVDALGVDPSRGLRSDDAHARGERYGANQLATVSRASPLLLLLGQFANAMVLVLVVAGVVTALTGEVTDTIVIGAIVVLNGVVGFVQEYRAQRALEALRDLEDHTATVRRDGASVALPSADVVPGDVVELSAGDVVPADLRLVEVRALRIAEAALTGESESAVKSVEALAPGLHLVAEQHNMAFKGTAVTFGRGVGVVVATGSQTELGRIADLLAVRSQLPTPLQSRLSALARLMALGAVAVCALVFVVGLVRGVSAREMFLTSVSLAVAAIPEGLPAVITVALALGARRMADRRALVRKLVAVETLGSVNVICTDKTGTLTQNRMMVVRAWTPDALYEVSGEGYSPEGEVTSSLGAESDPFLERLARVSALCNDAELHAPLRTGETWNLTGDPTEGALVAFATKCGVDPPARRAACARVEELPFDAERRLMTTAHLEAGNFVVLTKGALESVTSLLADPRGAQVASEVAARWAGEGLRVLAMADRVSEAPGGDLEAGLTLVGLVGIIDPPRREAASALKECRAAGIHTVIITGDHPATASSIAAQIGLDVRPEHVLSGEDLNALDDDALDQRVHDVAIYARVSPADKMRIVQSWQRHGAVVAMTGDGVNDAPALRQADIGVAMGVTGTDVSKEAADMVLADDNFATIVNAVEEGRRIYDNIRRVIRYLLSTNAGELWVMFVAPLIGLPIPLLAVQILWMNLITDGLPAIALGLEPVEPDAMGQPPRPRGESLFAGGLGRHVVWVGLYMAALVLGLEAVARARGWPWQTMVFTTLALAQLAHALAVRSQWRSSLRLSPATNPSLYVAVALTFVVQILVIYVGALQRIFHTQALDAAQLALVLVLSGSVFVAVEVEKVLLGRTRRVASR